MPQPPWLRDPRKIVRSRADRANARIKLRASSVRKPARLRNAPLPIVAREAKQYSRRHEHPFGSTWKTTLSGRAAQDSRFVPCVIIEGWRAGLRPTGDELRRWGEMRCRPETDGRATAAVCDHLLGTGAPGLVLAVISAPVRADDGRSSDPYDGTADGAGYAEAGGSFSNGRVTLL